MQQKKFLALGVAGFVVLGAVVFFAHKHSQPKKSQGAPELTADEILAERSRQAANVLNTSLGKAVVSKNWAEFDKTYKVQEDFYHFAEILHALYAEKKIASFSEADHAELMRRTLDTYNQVSSQNYHLLGLLNTQFERLPTPKHGGDNEKMLEAWVEDPKEAPIKRRMAVEKLFIQDLTPNAKAQDLFQKAILGGDALGSTNSEWIEKTDDIRNQKTQTDIVALLARSVRKMKGNEQASAVYVLSHHLDTYSNEVKKMSLQFVDSDELPKIETALRAFPNLDKKGVLSAKEKDSIVKRLSNLPQTLKTPFVQAKSAELMKQFGHI